MKRGYEAVRDADREQGTVLFLRARETNSSADARRLARWIGGNADREDLVAGLDRVWKGVGEMGGDPRLADLRADMDQVGFAPAAYRRQPYFALAASLLLCVLVGLALLIHGLRQPAPAEQFATTIGERKMLTLSDGSEILLDAASRIAVDYSSDMRVIRLSGGQALFDVAHDPARPFHVEAAGNDVRALGTRFNVSINRAQPSVSLLRGSVLVSRMEAHSGFFGLRRQVSRKPIATLKPGQQLAYDRDGHPRLSRFDPAVVNAWQNGRIVFEALPLSDAIAIVNRYSHRPVTLDPALPSRKMTGVFNAGDGLAFAQAAANYLPGSKVEVFADRIVIGKKDE